MLQIFPGLQKNIFCPNLNLSVLAFIQKCFGAMMAMIDGGDSLPEV